MKRPPTTQTGCPLPIVLLRRSINLRYPQVSYFQVAHRRVYSGVANCAEPSPGSELVLSLP